MKRFKLLVYVIAAALLIPLFCSVVAADLVTVYVADRNVALGKTYVASEPFTATPPQMGYQDIDGHELTDGVRFSGSDLYATCWHAFDYRKYTETNGEGQVVIDLGSVTEGLIEFRAEMINYSTSGIDAPSYLKFCVSTDGVTYSEPVSARAKGGNICDFVCKLSEPVSGRYVKMLVGRPLSGVFMFCSEIEVYDSKTVQVEESELSEEESYEEESSETEQTGIIETGVLDTEEWPLEFRAGSRFSLEDGKVLGVVAGDTPASLCRELVNMAGVQVLDASGREVTVGALANGYKLVQFSDKTAAVSYDILITGDFNSDGVVNSDDAIRLLRYVLFPESYSIEGLADFNGNGKIDSNDAIHLLRHVLFPENYALVEDSVPQTAQATVKHTSSILYTLTTADASGKNITLTFDKKDWGTWNIGTWSIGGLRLAGGGTDWEYVYRASPSSSASVVWSGGNHGNESLVSLKFFEGTTGEEIDLSAVGASHTFERFVMQEQTTLNWGDVSNYYANVVRTYTVVGRDIFLDVTYDFVKDCWYQLSYSCMFPVPKTHGLYIDFLNDDGTTAKAASLKVGAADYSGPFYGNLPASAAHIYGYKDTEYSFLIQVYTKNDSVDGFRNANKLMYWDMNTNENKLYFTKFDSNKSTKVASGTHWENSCSWTLLVNDEE